MTNSTLPPWRNRPTPAAARQIQQQLRRKVRRRNGPELRNLRYVAGADVSIRGDRAAAAVVVLDHHTLEPVEVAVARAKAAFPYIPGLLSFREIPIVLSAWAKLNVQPQALLVDGQGIAHPRRFGLASHLGVLLDLPTIGCAKTRLIGEYAEPHEQAGYYADLVDGDETIGAVLRTRDNVKPLFISIGHKIDLPTALDVVLACGAGYRLPEPTRLAHHQAGKAGSA